MIIEPNKSGCNVGKADAKIRILIAFLFGFTAIYTQCYLLMLGSIIFTYTAVKKHCFIYKLFNINKLFSLQNYYMSHLPKYNPSAVFMFDKDGKIYFENDSAIKNFKHINKLDDFKIKEFDYAIKDEIKDNFYYSYNNFHYQLDVQGVQEIDTVLMYATDITEVINLNQEIEETQKEIIYTMGEIGESRSKETGYHVKRVALYSELLAQLYGLSKEDTEKLKMASPMHDIGKVGIADAILNKPARLTSSEFEIMKTHANLGYEMLKKSNCPIIEAAAIVANEHHEKWDGSGYPNGTSGEEIHIYGRITAIADVFDALGSTRSYKKAWALDRILELFRDEKGKHFDPKLVGLFFDNLDDFLEIRNKFEEPIL